MRLRLWLAGLGFTVALPLQAGTFVVEKGNDPCVIASFAQLLGRGEGILGRLEAAAFVVMDADGGVSLVAWPRVALGQRERYRGTVPARTFALVHTHPSSMEQPSRGDVAESKRLGLPIYVLTYWAIWVVEPDGTVSPVVERRAWTKRMERSDCARVTEVAQMNANAAR
jgi:hypothetical protein